MVDIHRISAGNVNCYIVVDNDKAALIDTGRKRYRKKILDKCKEHHVSLIVLTHDTWIIARMRLILRIL